MGLLDILDHHYNNGAENSVEVEYRLVSWGEIYPPFQGDREHSTYARFILHEYPFKLFSVSIPHSELPQKLCLTFRDPIRTIGSSFIVDMSPYSDDVAKEFAAFLSVVTRRRVFPISQTRSGGLPSDELVDLHYHSHFQERQQLKEISTEDISLLLINLHQMNRQIAQQYLLSLRLYHSAIEMMYSEPEFAYLFLVMCIESIASAVYSNVQPDDNSEGRTDLDQYLDSTYPGWRKYCDISTSEKKKQVTDMLLTKSYFIRRKFRKFISENLPDTYWTEIEDDAKPDYLYSTISAGADGMGKKDIQHSDKTIQDYEKVKKVSLKEILDKIYSARSKFTHEGIRFPASIVVGHFRRIPAEAFRDMVEKRPTKSTRGEWFLDVPPLLTFERMVSYSLVEFLRSQVND